LDNNEGHPDVKFAMLLEDSKPRRKTRKIGEKLSTFCHFQNGKIQLIYLKN
jgi:hypothetical protein